jgi:hypothetical protein
MVAVGLCVPLAGGGHGTYDPLIFHLSPAFVVAAFLCESKLLSPIVLGTALLLYTSYALTIVLFRRWRRPAWGLGVVLVIHYVGVAVVIVDGVWESMEPLGYYLAGCSLLNFLALFSYWVGLHVLAFQFAFSSTPYRPHWTRRATVAMGVALVVAVIVRTACYIVYMR